MIRIIHLTDFHLNPDTLRDWQNYVGKSLILKLKDLHAQKPINIIAFTGDMVDEGGKNYKNINEAFALFKNEVIDPIVKDLSLSDNQFLIIPGNHDTVRTKDEKRIELGNVEYFKEHKNIADFMNKAVKNNDFSGMERMHDYKDFEKIFYSGAGVNSKLSIFGSSFKLDINGVSVGICCLNSSWRCYSKKTDKGNLLIGEEQLVSNTKFIENSSIKIALMHHPLDWLSPVEQSTITNHINKDFHLLLVGHVHENKTSVQTGFNGTLFTNIAPSGLNDIRSDSRTFANGFTVVDYNQDLKTIYCEYLKYNLDQKEFVLNTDVGKGGIFSGAIPDEKSAKNINLINKVLLNIKADHYKEMDDHLIGQKAEKAPISIKEAFVLPPIDQGNSSEDENEQEELLGISEVVKSKSNFMFFGSQETGKTIFLYRLVREFVDGYDYIGKIPVYIDFDEIGNKSIETCIREYLGCSSSDITNLLDTNLLILLVDNLNYKKNIRVEQLKTLEKFIKEYNKVDDKNIQKELKIVATAENGISGMLPTDYIDLCKIPFSNFYIRSLKTKEIKCLMKLWSPDEDELKSEERLDKMITSFNSYALPSTAMSVSLFLWSMDNKEKPPINHAVLLEIYIQILLEKLAKENIYRAKFDFTNKVQLLAKIAEEIDLNQPDYSIAFSEFEKIVEKYLNDVGFDFDADIIVKYFLERKLFVKCQVNRIKFTYSCYFHFFIAKRMVDNKKFKSYVMEEDNYYKYHREIDYYTALTRSDKELFEDIFDRFEKRFKPTDFILDKVKEVFQSIDSYFTPIVKDKPYVPVAKNVEIGQIKENRPSEEMMEEFHDKQLKAIRDPGTILKKEGSISLEILLVIMSNVLRNSEGVEDRKLKKKTYDSLVKYSMIYMVLYKQYLIDYVLKHEKLPPSVPYEITYDQMLKNIPLFVQGGLSNHLKTAKLAPIVLDKIKEDKQGVSITDSDIEAFLSVALYSDIQGRDYPKHFKSLIKRLGGNIVRDYSFYKLIDYYYKRTKPGSPNEETYLDLLAELRIRSQKLPRRMKERVIKTLRDGRKAFQKKFGDDVQ